MPVPRCVLPPSVPGQCGQRGAGHSVPGPQAEVRMLTWACWCPAQKVPGSVACLTPADSQQGQGRWEAVCGHLDSPPNQMPMVP